MSFPTFQSLNHLLLFILPIILELIYVDPHELEEYDNAHCGGSLQSPISIDTFKATPITLPPLIFQLYDELFIDRLTVRNNGHSIEFLVPETIFGRKPSLSGGSLQHEFIANSVHFHWGSPNQKGTEHMLNGKRYDLEMHIVHINSKYTITEALHFNDGFSVVAILFKAVRWENVYYPGLNSIFDTLDDLVKFNSTAKTTSPITLGSLLDDIYRRDFITYDGSLTTPPCSETVTWNIFPEILPVSRVVLSKFWNILNRNGDPLQNNYRPIQKRNDRKVYRRTTFFWNERFFRKSTNDFNDYGSQWS